MNEKEKIILKLLITQDGWLTSFSISSLLGISVRSVKSYIGDINTVYPGLVVSSRKGFFVEDKKRLAGILQTAKSGVLRQQGVEDRKKYILQKLLLEQEQYDLDIFADELAVSPVTLIKELSRLNGELAEYELSLKTRNNLASITGPEANKKKMISKLIYEDARESFLSIRIIQDYLPHYDLAELRKIVFSCLRKHRYFMDDFSIMNLILHIAITMERHGLCGVEIDGGKEKPGTFVNAHIRAIMTDIAEGLHEKFDMEFTQWETHDFSLLVMASVIKDSVDKIRAGDIEEAVGEEVMRLVKTIQRKTGELFNITLTDPDFTVRFTLHVRNLLIRLENKIRLRNPQASVIKNMYPFIYDVSVYIASIIAGETGHVLSEDEISYIALHLGVLIEENNNMKNKVRAVLLNPQYFYSSMELVEKISQTFEDNLHITGIVSLEDELENYSDYDLIISTIPLAGFPGTSFIHVSRHLNNRDILAVYGKIADILKMRIKAKMEARLKQIFHEELFYANPGFRDQNDAITVMAGDLVKCGYVDTDFGEKLFQREKVSSSAYTNIAMPHPLEMCALSSVVGVSLHPHGIAWNNTRVNIVFLLAINTRDRLFFKDIFDFITEIISDEHNLKVILEAKTFDRFIDILVSFAK
ncbi:MAG: PTS sugar transporter subunit IIA [Treponema sp.]|nr:PTS sugar transporter subunit IIA [Treponema sp.]